MLWVIVLNLILANIVTVVPGRLMQDPLCVSFDYLVCTSYGYHSQLHYGLYIWIRLQLKGSIVL